MSNVRIEPQRERESVFLVQVGDIYPWYRGTSAECPEPHSILIENPAEHFITSLRNRLADHGVTAQIARHGVTAQITRWRYFPATRSLEVWLPRPHRELLKSILRMMFQEGKFSWCDLPPTIEMKRHCGRKVIQTYNAQGDKVLLCDVHDGSEERLSWEELQAAEAQYDGRMTA